jgi:hypothetical protein
MHSVIPRYVSIAGFLDDAALERIMAVAGVESAETSKNRHKHTIAAFTALRWVSRLLALGMAVALLTGLIHLARMNAFLHSEALALLRLWGAGELTLRAPGALTALLVGLIGGTLACVGWLAGSQWLVSQVRELSPMLREMAPATANFGFALMAAGIVSGALAGAFTSTSYGSRATTR